MSSMGMSSGRETRRGMGNEEGERPGDEEGER